MNVAELPAHSKALVSGIRFEYEFEGRSIAELSERHQIHEEELREIAESEGWKPLLVLRDTFETIKKRAANLTEFAETLREEFTAKFTIADMVQQVENRSTYIQLERLLAEKAVQVASMIDPGDPGAVRALKDLTGVLRSLRAEQPIDVSAAVVKALKADEGSGEGGLQVLIQNHIES